MRAGARIRRIEKANSRRMAYSLGTFESGRPGYGVSAGSEAMVEGLSGEVEMSELRTKHIYEGRYVAEVEVELIEDQTGWSPYLSVEDARKLDEVRAALRQGDLRAASEKARVFELRPVVAH